MASGLCESRTTGPNGHVRKGHAGTPGDGRARSYTRPVDEQPPARRRRLARSTAIFALATGLSRILGLVREIVARYYFGTVGAINAFEVAFLIPNTVRALVADAALSSAFVPVFSELLEKGERKRAWRVASSLFWLVLLGLGGLTALFIVISPWIMRAFGYGDLAVGLSRVLFPIVVLLGLSGIVVGILNSYDHFTVPALTPVFWNIAIIVGLVIGVPRADGIDAQLYVYAFSILIATVIQFLLPLPWLRGRDGRLQVVIDWRDPAVRQTLVLMVPITIGLGLINFNAVVDTFFAARLIDRFHAPSAINAAFRLYMLPQGMFSVAVATVLFPSLARLATRSRLRRLPQDGHDRDPADRVPARSGERLLRRARRADRARRLPARRLHAAADACRGGVARGVLARARLQRLHADAQPRVLQPAVALDPDVGRARQPRAERGARRGVLPVRDLGPAAGDVAREHRRLGRALRPAAPAARTTRPARERLGVRAHRRCIRRRAARSPTASGVGSTRSSVAAFAAQIVSVGTALLAATAAYGLACRALGVHELRALLSLRRRR